MPISRHRLERTFLKQTGRSPAAAYPEIRLQVARDQLSYSGNCISHVAAITEVQSDAHFRGAFRKRFGASPTTGGRSFRGGQRSKYYPVGTRLVDTRSVSVSLGEQARLAAFFRRLQSA